MLVSGGAPTRCLVTLAKVRLVPYPRGRCGEWHNRAVSLPNANIFLHLIQPEAADAVAVEVKKAAAAAG